MVVIRVMALRSLSGKNLPQATIAITQKGYTKNRREKIFLENLTILVYMSFKKEFFMSTSTNYHLL